MRKWFWLEALLWAVLIFGLFVALISCAPTNPPASRPRLPFSTKTPPTLTGVDSYLDFLIAVSIILIGGAVGAFFFLPAAHRISGWLIVGGGGILATCLVLKTVLWIIPWIAAGLLIGGLGLLGYEVWKKYIRETPSSQQ